MTPGFTRNMFYLNKGEQESEIWMFFQKEEKVDIFQILVFLFDNLTLSLISTGY